MESSSEIGNIDKQIQSLKIKQEKLLDMKLDEVIDERTYLFKHNQLENEIKDFLEQKIRLKKDSFLVKTQLLLELVGSLYRAYFRRNEDGKVYIIRNLMLELFINNKKELQIAETPLFESSKLLKIAFGTPQNFNIRTYKEKLSRINLEDLKAFTKFIKDLQS